MKLFICTLLLVIGFTCNVHDAEGIELLPEKNLFDTPIADPRWPKFLMGVSHDFENNFGETLWTFNFGENIGLVQFGDKKSPFEFGVQAGVFGFMDIDHEPTRLINSDYFVALGLSHLRGNFQHLLQLSHVSSHVGDELLLSPDAQDLDRINLSYETLKWFIRYKSTPVISPYLILGYIVHVDPGYVKRFSVAAGVDYFSRKIIFDDSTRVIFGAFVNSWQENNYYPSVTVRFGLQYERTKYCNRFLQLLLQYRGGKSQQGQFYGENIQQVGILAAYSS